MSFFDLQICAEVSKENRQEYANSVYSIGATCLLKPTQKENILSIAEWVWFFLHQLPSGCIGIVFVIINARCRSALSVPAKPVPPAHTGLRNVMLNKTLHKQQNLVHNSLMSSQLNLNLKLFVYPGHAQRLIKAVKIIITKVNLNYFICIASESLIEPIMLSFFTVMSFSWNFNT